MTDREEGNPNHRINALVARLNANPDRGTPCWSCGTSAKTCQAAFVRSGGDERCCSQCRIQGGRIMHAEVAAR